MERFIDPKTLARVRDLPLVARRVADGFLHGIQQSHQRGVGVEFSQYRGYEPGDEPGRIDWKLFARSDRYFVREAQRESEIVTWFVIDASRSMLQQSEGGAWSKFEYARHLVATLSYLAQRQGDGIGLLALSSGEPVLLPPLAGERQWHRLLKALMRLTPGDCFPDLERLRPHLARLQVPGMVFVASDFYERQGEILDFIRQVSTSRTEAVAMQLQSRDEREFPWTGPVRFEDLETGETVLVSGRAARPGYLEALEDHQAALRQSLAAMSASHGMLDIDQPLDEALHDFLTRRRKRLI